MTIFSVDVETSGLDPILNDVTSISIIEVDSEEHFTCRILDDMIVWDESTKKWAEENIHPSVDKFVGYSVNRACALINVFLDKFPKPYTFMAWPASFDFPFVQKLYSKSEQPFPFHYRTLDLHSMLVGKFGGDIAAGRSDEDLPGIVAEPPKDLIHNPFYDALCQLYTYRNILKA